MKIRARIVKIFYIVFMLIIFLEFLVSIAVAQSTLLNKIFYDDFALDRSAKIIDGEKAGSGFDVYHTQKWQDGVIPIKYAPTISSEKKQLFQKACDRWAQVAQVSCVEHTQQSVYLLVTDQIDKNCWTDVGMGLSESVRYFNFGDDSCWHRLALLHEVGHVLGLMHEHQRPDRDRFLQIKWENLGAFAFAYEKLSFGKFDEKSPYDFYSIMHYHNKAFSTTGKYTMTPQKGYDKYLYVMGYAKDLSNQDIQVIQKIYGKK